MTTEGPTICGTGTNNNSFGTVDWLNPGNITADDNTVAGDPMSIGGGGNSQYLRASNFGFAIPTGATINGITVTIGRWKSSGTLNIQDVRVRIVKADATIGTTDKAATGVNWELTETAKTYGGVTDLWGETWTAENINDIDFGVVLAVTAVGNPRFLARPSVDYISITIDYTEEAGASSQSYVSGDGLTWVSVTV